MTTPDALNRRRFLQRSAAAGSLGVLAPQVVPAAALGREDKPAPSERLGIALIGCGGMGMANLHNCAKYPDVAVVGVCDVWGRRLDRAAKKYHASAKPYKDYRELLQKKDLDGVIVGTPPHWHCLQAVDACRAGKDVYLQKPMTLQLGESLAVRNAARKHGRVVQVGTQIHATEHYRRVVEWVRSGKLGKIGSVFTFNVMNQGPDGLGFPPKSDPPADLDWDFWLGPYPMQSYNPLIVQDAGTNPSFMELSGGWTCGMAPHIVDLPVWAFELGYPETTYSTGGRFTIHDCGDSPDIQEALWQYPGLTMHWKSAMANSFGFDFGRDTPGRRLGIYFFGVGGTLFTNYSHMEISPEGKYLVDKKPPKRSIPPSPGQEREWLDCIKSRKQPSCNSDYHSKIDVALVLANLSLKLGRALRFDSAAEKIVDDAEAEKLSVPEYRAPWKFPGEYLHG
jgi:predicted dehydrogenase